MLATARVVFDGEVKRSQLVGWQAKSLESVLESGRGLYWSIEYELKMGLAILLMSGPDSLCSRSGQWYLYKVVVVAVMDAMSKGSWRMFFLNVTQVPLVEGARSGLEE